ncbi:MAG: hypothetical protein DRI26_02840 [Chloroflexi bacterium]|nr:MAG: hypothetical protein DRI26_02840 [Chloroflexota bacterium]
MGLYSLRANTEPKPLPVEESWNAINVTEVVPPPEEVKKVPWWAIGLIVVGAVGGAAYMIREEKRKPLK